MPSLLLIARKKEDALWGLLEKEHTLMIAHSGKQALTLAKEATFKLLVLDAASMGTTGERICRTLKATFDNVPIVHIHPGPKKAAHTPADVVLFPPVSGRRLVNTIGRLLDDDEEEVIDYGPFSMNVLRRILIAHGEETQLTPKQAMLVEVFLRNPGKTVDRKTLMEKVWDTDYMGDTRTLDVHIRWVRKVLENGEDKPRYLQTVRGVGYKLVIPD